MADEKVVYGENLLTIIQSRLSHGYSARMVVSTQDLRDHTGDLMKMEREKCSIPAGRIRIYADERLSSREVF